MKIGRLIQNQKPYGILRAGLLLLCTFFLLGLILGGAVHGAITPQDDQQMREYLLHYAQVAEQSPDLTASALSVLGTYLRYPLVTFILGFSALGVLLVPILCLTQAFFLAFSVQCFASALGRSGVLLALGSMGIRCLITVPCTLFLSLWSIKSAIGLAQNRKGKAGRRESVYDSAYYARLFICLLILIAGVLLELFFVPRLVGRILSTI